MLRHIATMPKKESEEEESIAKRPRQDSSIEFLLGDSLGRGMMTGAHKMRWKTSSKNLQLVPMTTH